MRMELDSSLLEPLTRAKQAGSAVWGEAWGPDWYSFAPGRVEVLGNHLDYNGGPVLAAAIDRYTVVLADRSSSDSQAFEVLLADMDPAVSVAVAPDKIGDWQNTVDLQQSADFVYGAVASLVARGKPTVAARIAVASSVPIGVGVSSSAALCVALVQGLAAETLAYEELVLIAQEAEHRAGTPCGTMDQAASVSGGMIRFDGADNSARQLNPDLEGHSFLVVDSGVKRSLVNSSYPRRVEECHVALDRINSLSATSYPSLASIPPTELAREMPVLEGSVERVLLRRVKHVVSEVQRVQDGEAALIRRDWNLFGQLMTESGRSSAADYEISHEVVEDLVQRLIETPGVLGARMMGGGEGGSLIALIEPDDRGEILRRVDSSVNSRSEQGAKPQSVYRFSFAQGARHGRLNDLHAD
jgi:galactokinase